MSFLKNGFRFLSTLYNLILTVILIILFFVFLFWIPIDIIENATWIYSSSMQTLAALIALLPISYGYYINNIDKEVKEEMDSYVIDRIKRIVYYEMMIVIIYCIIVIIVNLLSFFINRSNLTILLTSLLTIEGIGLMAIYIYRLFDPNKVKEVMKEFDSSSGLSDNQVKITLDKFITDYLALESSVKDYISNENDNELVDNLPLYDIIDNFSKDFIDIGDNLDSFKEIIFHRNNLIHNYNEVFVDYSKYEKMIELKELFDKMNTSFIQRKIFGNVAKIRNTIEKALREYKTDFQNKDIESNILPEDFKEEIVSLLGSYFVSDYYISNSFEQAKDVDFEIVQNNYSERRLLGIDIKSINKRSYTQISKSFFERTKIRFMYVFLINFEPLQKIFTIQYMTKDNELKIFTV